MPDFRAYHPSDGPEPAEFRLGADESHHLVVVNRCGRGDPVVVFDGRGREWLTECIDPSRTAAALRVREARAARNRSHEITLGQALPKGSTMDDIVRQATEIGVAHIVPLVSERTQVHLEGDRQEKKLEKWRTAAIEAAKQCGNPWLPEIHPVQKLPDFLAISGGTRSPDGFQARPESALHQKAAEPPPDYDLKLIASLHGGAVSLKHTLAHHRARHPGGLRKAIWLVGPEGDFSPAEMTTAITTGFLPVTLGPLVLRSDTAAVYALSILSYELANS